jgi:transcriptional regulator with XRE-family HTH domain
MFVQRVFVVFMQQIDVAANVRAELARRRITQTDVAERLGVSRQNVAQRLNGSVDFRVGELISIANMLEITIGDLVGGVKASA